MWVRFPPGTPDLGHVSLFPPGFFGYTFWGNAKRVFVLLLEEELRTVKGL